MVSTTRSFRFTQTIGERFRNMPKVTIAKIEGRARGGGREIALAMDMCFAVVGNAIFGQPEVASGLFRAAVLRRDCHGSSGGDARWRCS
jgi:enoyl-CoA hydratase/carnithine racemase